MPVRLPIGRLVKPRHVRYTLAKLAGGGEMSRTSTWNDWTNPLPGVPDVESPFFHDLFARKVGHPGWPEMAAHMREHGFALIDFPDTGFDGLVDQIQADLESRYDWDWWRAEGGAGAQGLRVQDAWSFSDAVRTIASNQIVLQLLEYLYGRPAWPFQTLNFPVGTQQHFHTDSIHFSSVPERFMCGVWVALEDVDESNGPLLYYPGSHKLPIFTNEHIGHLADDPGKTRQNVFEPMWRELMRAEGLEEKRFHAKKGQALIWSANLFHGGAPHLDLDRTRWSQVTHYYFSDCLYYTPLNSDPAFGRMHIREMEDARTGRRVANQYLGNPIPPDFMERMKRGLPEIDSLPADFDAAGYLAANPDVAGSGLDPARHYLTYGYAERRSYRS
jgi:hypothetical protein